MRESDIQLSGRRVILRVVMPADYDFIRKLEYHPRNIATYRHRGVTISPEQHVQSLWQGVLAQFLICEVRSWKPLGIVAAFNYDARNGHTHFAVILAPDAVDLGWPIEGLRLFIDYLFTVFPMRKLYSEVLDFNIAHFASLLGSVLTPEGRLREHEYYDGQYWDKHILSISRSTWEKNRAKLSLLSTAAPTPDDAQPGAMPPMDALPLEEQAFFAHLAATFPMLRGERLMADTRLVDLGMDSLLLFEILMFLSDLAGHDVPDELAASFVTLGDVYYAYVTYFGRASA